MPEENHKRFKQAIFFRPINARKNLEVTIKHSPCY